MPGPYAVRVRTADGWQDIAMTGPPGPPGERWFTGPTVPSVDQPVSGARTGDWYIVNGAWDVNTGGDYYECTDAANQIWVQRGTFTNHWKSGYGAPLSNNGEVGDWYIDLNNGDAYQKISATSWQLQLNIKGAPGAVVIYEQPNAPSSPQIGQIWIDTDDNIPSGSVVPRRTGFTWAIKGTILAETQPSFFVPVAAGQISRLIGVRCKLASGGSVACQLTRYGSNIGTAFTVTPTLITTSFAPITLVDGDDIGLVTSNPSGSPTTLTVTAIMEHYT
jgi:hypothetical protein